jgi:hypothetical protein
MKKYWQAIGITAIAVGVLYYPALKLYQYIKNRRKGNSEGDNEQHHLRTFFSPAYRGVHKPHHRSKHNGHSHNNG